MKRFHITLLALAALALCSCATTTPQPAAAGSAASPTASAAALNLAEMEKTVIDLEKKSWELYRSRNAEAVRKLNAPGYRAIYQGEIKDGEVDIQGMTDYDIKSQTFSDMKVTFPVRDTAILTYKYTQTAAYKGKDNSGSYVAAAAWVNINGEWKQSFYTDAKAEPQPAK
ncbi:MAG: nuclear transport factor 2 family protein [Blastocatellia bacterium]